MATADPSAKITVSTPPRQDLRALWGGIAFALIFTAIIAWAGQFLDRSMLLPDQGANWYFWKLPVPTFWTRFTAWGFYLAHQITLWGLIAYAQSNVKRYTSGLHPVNWWALGANAFFIVLHLLQTHLWYDGLAQDVSIWSSQISVIILLVWILVMENKRRGLFFGKPIPMGKEILGFARRYHGYYFAWAIVYTFWYHPMESSMGHLIGFLYMFLLMLQGSLFFTRVHINKYWTATQEVMVLFHGALVATQQGNNLWPMFFFGFLSMFIITQMHGLGLSRPVKTALFVAYILGIVGVFGMVGYNRLWQVISIPFIEYLSVFAMVLVFWLGLKAFGAIRRPKMA